MKINLVRRLLLAGACIFSASAFSQQANNDWENPGLLDVNKEAPHASFMVFDNAEDVGDR